MAKKNNNYFNIFVDMVGYCRKAAGLLHETLQKFDVESLPEKLSELHGVEHEGDVLKHKMMETLAREFITPIEREDIMQLAQEIDNVTDGIEDVLIRLYMFHIRSIRMEALAFSDAIVRCCEGLQTMMEEFENFRKSKTIHAAIVEINRLEEEGDRLYLESMRNLYGDCKDPIEVMGWTETFNRLERCCDACEDVADVVESVIMKNT